MFSKIQTRITLLLTAISLAFLASLLLQSNSEENKLERIFHERSREKEFLVKQVLSTLGSNLSTFTYDYSHWDDMITFLSTADRQWGKVNLTAVLPTFKVAAVWVFREDFTPVYSTYDSDSLGLPEFPFTKEQLTKMTEKNWYPHFFIQTRAGIMEICGAPVHPQSDTSRISKPRGYFLAGRIWDKDYLEHIGLLLTSNKVTLSSPDSPNSLRSEASTENVVYICRTILSGWDGKPLSVLNIETEYSILHEVMKNDNSGFLQSIIFTVVILGSISLFLFRYVLTPVRLISNSIEKEEPSVIRGLLNDRTEFGKLALLIAEFFRQKDELVRQIEEKNQTQAELQEKISSLQLLKALQNSFLRALDLKQIYDLVYETVPFYLGSRGIHRASLMIYDAGTNSLISRKRLDISDPLSRQANYQPVDLSISGKCFSTREVVIVEDCSHSSLIPKVFVDQYSIKAAVALPIIFDGHVLGVLRLDNIENPQSFSPADIELFSMLSEQLGIVIKNACLFAEQKQIEGELRKSEETYRAIFENTGTASVIIEEDGTISLVNAEWVKLSGYSSEETIGKKKWTEFVFPEDLEFLMEYHAWRRTDPDSVPSKYEIRLMDRHGNMGYYINKVSMIPGTTRSIASMIDITERRRTELALQKFSYSVEQTPVSVFMTDTEGRIEYVNPNFLKVTGYSAEEVIGQNPRFLKSDKTPQEEYEKMWKTIKSGRQWRGELCNRKKNGELYWEIVSISPIKNETGDIIYFVAIREDITDRKEVEVELKSAKEKAEASDRLKSEFLAQMSHEIRTPINTILSYSSLIKEELENSVDDDMKICFRNIASAGSRIIRTVDLILNMSELQTGSYEYSPKPFDLYCDLLEKIYSGFLHTAREKKLQMIINRDTLQTGIVADEYSVGQIFMNLIDNAIKYTNKGSVSVTVFRDQKDHLAVEVSDTGIGINQEFLPNLFTPFSQEEQGYTRKFDGNGLGLALVKKYCELNNLIIEVETEKHIGTTFRVIFPS